MPKMKNARVRPMDGDVFFLLDDDDGGGRQAVQQSGSGFSGGTGGSGGGGNCNCPPGPPGPPGKNAFEEITFDVDFNDFKIINLGDPTDIGDAVNLGYLFRLLNDYMKGDVVGSIFEDKTVVGIYGREILDSTPLHNQVISWDATIGYWTYKKLSSEMFKIIDFQPEDGSLYEIGESVDQPVFTVEFNHLLDDLLLTNDDNDERKVVIATPERFNSDRSYMKDVHGDKVTFEITATSEYSVTEKSTTEIYWGTKAIWSVYKAVSEVEEGEEEEEEGEDGEEEELDPPTVLLDEGEDGEDGEDEEGGEEEPEPEPEEPVTIEDVIAYGLEQEMYEVKLEAKNTVYVNAQEDEYIYYFHRKDYGDTELLVNSIVGGFDQLDDVVIENEYGVQVMYSVFRSEHPNLGDIKLVVRER